MNVFAKFDEIPSIIIQNIKEKGVTESQLDGRKGRTDNVKTVYLPTNTICGGINIKIRYVPVLVNV